MKQDFGFTKVNFKKQKAKTDNKDLTPFPEFIKPQILKIHEYTEDP